MSIKNYMIDIETMSTKPNAAIVSIGAVEMDFEKGVLGREFYAVVDLKSSVAAGGHVRADTVKWWDSQSDKAREVLDHPNEIGLDDALDFLSHFLTGDKFRIWANGANFDPVILRSAYEAVGVTCPWRYSDEMCYRTMRKMNPDVVLPEMAGVAHNALADAVYQGGCLLLIMGGKS